jgi:hypothetical protein
MEPDTLTASVLEAARAARIEQLVLDMSAAPDLAELTGLLVALVRGALD